MEKEISAIMPSSKDSISKFASLYSDGNILDETQRLIEEAELKLRTMEGEIHQDANVTNMNISPSFDDSNLMRNHRLRQALDHEMKKLERELEIHQRKHQSAINPPGTAVDHSESTSTVKVDGSKNVQCSRIHRPCRKAPAEVSPEDVVDVVRTARDSVHGALVAARKLSASLEKCSPRGRVSNSARGHASRGLPVPTPTDNLPTDSESARLCSEHGTKRKVCSCLRPADYRGPKLEECIDAARLSTHLVPAKSNVGIFRAKSSTDVKQDCRQPQKRLEMSVMPPVSIKRSLEKQVMPVIRVPFPGSNPDPEKKENTAVIDLKYADPAEYNKNLTSHALGEHSTPSVPVAVNVERKPANSAVSQQLNGTERLQELNPLQVKQIVESLLEKMMSSQIIPPPNLSQPGEDSFSSVKSDEVPSEKTNVSSVSAGNTSKTDKTEKIVLNSLSRFLENYSKAAVESTRAKRKAVERRREEALSMKAREQRYKNASADNQQSEATHPLIGPFRRAILKGSLRKNTQDPTASDENTVASKQLDIAGVPQENTAEKSDVNTNLDKEECEELHETRAMELKASLGAVTSVESSPPAEVIAEAQSAEPQESIFLSSAHLNSIAEPVPRPPAAPAETSLKAEESSNDEYEDDWEEENEGEKINEESVETRDVGDGSERESHEDGSAHPLRSIVEIEENPSLSVSLVHHEPSSLPSQSGPSKLEAHTAKIPAPLLTETKTHQPIVEQAKEEFSSSRAFLEMTETLKKMLETVVSSLVENKQEGQSKDRRGVGRYHPTSSGSTNDAGSGSDTSFTRTTRHSNTNRSLGRRVRFKAGVKRSSATQTEGDPKQDAETQVTPDKRATEKGPQLADALLLRPSTLSLARLPFRPRPSAMSDVDPTSRLLAFGKSSRSIQGLPLLGEGPVHLSPEPEGRGSTSQCDSLSSSCSSVLPTDGWEYPANNTLMSLSEGEVLAYHSCSCSEGEICVCGGKGRKCRPYGGERSDRGEATRRAADEPLLAGSAPFTPNPWSTLNSTAADSLLNLSEHFSEGEVIEKLIGVSSLLNNTRDQIISFY